MALANASSQPVALIDELEAARLAAVDDINLLDTPREEEFDRITRLVRNVLGVRVAIVSLIDGHRQWYKACDGLNNDEVLLEDSFCRLVLAENRSVIVTDAKLDPRFAAHPSVTGDPFIRFYAGIPMINRAGLTIGTLCAIDFEPRDLDPAELQILEDQAQLAMTQMELRAEAATDVLTGALSRRALQNAATRVVAVAKRQRQELSIITVDIDRFKAINDKFGHPAGDKTLKSVARVCRSMLRDFDLFGRAEGDVFIAVVHFGQDATLEIAERMRAAIAALHDASPADQPPVTASLGVASLTPSIHLYDELLTASDAALHGAKAAGGNRCSALAAPTPAFVPQRRVLKAGQIVFLNRTSTIDCTVRRLGSDGASIDVSSTRDIPKEFFLSIRADGINVRCRVVASTERNIDVEFA